MIVLLMALVSLSTIYFVLLLERKGMRTAATMLAVLFTYIISWTYAVFILDVADLGFTDVESGISLLHGSNIYHSFVDIAAKMSVIPLPFLEAIVLVAIIVFMAGFAVAFHGLFEITKQICKYIRDGLKNRNKTHILKIMIPESPQYVVSILRMNCRANC